MAFLSVRLMLFSTFPRIQNCRVRGPNGLRGAISFHELMLDDPLLDQRWRRVSELEILVCVPEFGQRSR